MCEQKFFRCNHCGNLAVLMHDGSAPMICCGDPMGQLVPNTVEASSEKHIPVVSSRERLVHAKIGSLPHPMTEDHHIEFIYLQGERGGQFRCLKPSQNAEAMFIMDNDTALSVYAYCNLHGLWQAAATQDFGGEHSCGCGNADHDHEHHHHDHHHGCGCGEHTGDTK